MGKFVEELDGGKYKPAHYKQDYTLEQIKEISKCINDPIYFIKKFVKIIHPTLGSIPFNLYDFQERLLRNYHKYDRVICMLPRQTGKTQSSAAYLLHQAMFKDDQTILIAANKGSTAKEIMERVRDMYMEAPWFLKPGITVNNVFEMKFDNGSRILAETTTKNTGRGRSISILYLDEFAFVNESIQKDFWTSIQPTLSTGGQMIITSTPNTDEDKFANIWFGANEADNSFEWRDELLEQLKIDKKRIAKQDYQTVYEVPSMEDEYNYNTDQVVKTEGGGFKRFFVHWAEHPDRDEKFKAKTLSEGVSLSEWNREYCCAFVSADETLIDSTKLNLLNVYVKKPIYVDKHRVHWYEEIKPNTIYGVVLDPSEGTGGDNAVIQAFSLPDMMQVAEWAMNEIDQIDQTKQLIRIIKTIDREQQIHPDHVGESLIYYSVECNGIGQGILNIIEYDGEENIPGYLIDSDGNKTRGIRTTEPSKKEYALKLKTYVERGVFYPSSAKLVTEFKTFVRRGKSYEAKTGSKDDRVMGCVLMTHLLDELQHYEEDIQDQLSFSVLDVTEEYEDDDFMPSVI